MLVTDLRAGTFFEDENEIFQVLSYAHTKMGRGSASIKVKVRNVRSGAIIEKSFINGARIKDIFIQKRDLQYLYKDLSFAYFMDVSSFEQIQASLKTLGDSARFLKEGEMCNLSFLKGEVASINLPPKIDLRILETDPGIKGNSATNIFKDAVLENGIRTKVPLFIKEGDRVRIDTRTGEYTQKV